MRDKKELIGISVVLGVIWSTYIVVATLLKQNHDMRLWEKTVPESPHL